MDLSIIADALHEIAVELKKHTTIKQEMNIKEANIQILNKIEVLLKTVIFTKAIGSKGDIYEIDIENMTCTCPAFVYSDGQNICKHLKKALKYKADYENNFQYPKLSELYKKENY